MPELPEVETIRRGLEEKVLGRLVLKVVVSNPVALRSSKESFEKVLRGKSFDKIGRRGKMLIFFLKKDNSGEDRFLLVRLGMTGRLVYFGKEDALWGSNSYENKNSYSSRHCHIVFCFKGGGSLLFCDVRRFGYMEIVDKEKLEEKLAAFGPEPLGSGFTLVAFRRTLEGRKGNIKAFLLDQKRIAGIGNIYADEILFDAGISPLRNIQSLSSDEVKKIYTSIKKILKRAVEKRGTTFSDYVDASGNKGSYKNSLKVYGRGGKDCLGCSGKVKKIIVAGRGTNFCDRCQR